jgi:uncharacterized protein YdhG (YjbR/CyaY superfamily)
MAEPTTVEEYLETLSEAQRSNIELMRTAINAAAPEATETIAYSMPALRTRDGQFLLSYAAYKNHYSFFPASDEVVKGLGEAIQPYLAGKGTIRFPASRPIPTDLLTRIVEIRVRENAAHGPR